MTGAVDEIREQFLPAATVRIYVGGRRTGTGFFASSGIVVTCKHVLTPLDLGAEGAAAMIEVRGFDPSAKYEVKQVRHVSADDLEDLAVLRVEPGDVHPCALLLSGLNAGDEVHAFGYTKEHDEGIPVSAVGEGLTGDKKLFKLKAGQIQPGMSGSPLLNVRTGAVCAVLKRTIDARQAIGGYAIPISSLFALSEPVLTGNRAYHTSRSYWLDRLPAKARQDWHAAQASEPGSEPASHVLVVSVTQHEDRWEVSAERFPERKPIGPVTVDLNTVRLEVARLFRDWASPDSTWRGRVDRGEELRLLGKILSSAVLPGPVASEVTTLLGERETGWIQVALRFEAGTDADLEYLPWEHLYLASVGDIGEVYLAREVGLAFARTRGGEIRDSDEPAPRELSVLLVAATPPGESEPEREVAMAVEAVASKAKDALDALERVSLSVAECPNPNQLLERVATDEPDIVHYVGFGQFMDGKDEIALGGSRAGTEFVDSAMFAAALEESPPRVAILQLCDAPSLIHVAADLAPFAPAVLSRGVEALVAYQYPTRSHHSECFNEHFYRKLVGGAAVEMAVQSARKALYMKDPKSRAFLAPTVCVRQPGGIRLTARDTESAPRSWVGAASAYG